MLISVAWKNVWRNKVRSFVVITAVSIGIFSAIYSFAIMNGLIKQKISSTINFETSHIQIHHSKFKENKETCYYIPNSQKIVEEISSFPEVESVTEKTIILSFANTSNSSSGVIVNGINPEKEKKLTKIYTTIQDSAGSYLDSEKNNQVLISVNLADKLQLTNFQITEKSLSELEELEIPEKIISQISVIKDIKFRTKKSFKDTLKIILGKKKLEKFDYSIIAVSRTYKMKSKIILKMQNINGEFVEKAFKIGGIFTTNNNLFDEMNVFVEHSQLTELLGYDQNFTHEITILLKDEKLINEVVRKLKSKYPDLQIQSWKELKPVIMLMKKMISISYFLFTGIILFALGFGIVNTMLMVVLERVKELGMLMAIGMNKIKIFKMIMLESIFLSITGGIIGILISSLLINIFGKTGHNFSNWVGEGYETIGFDTIIYPALNFQHYIGIGLFVIFTGVISAIYPAKKALKLNPVETLKNDI